MSNKRIYEAFAWTERHPRRYLQSIETQTAGSQGGGTIPWKELAQLPWKLTKAVEHIHLERCEYYFLDREGRFINNL